MYPQMGMPPAMAGMQPPMGMPGMMPGMPMGPAPGMDQSALLSILLALMGQGGMQMPMGGGMLPPGQLMPPVMPPS